MKEDSLFPKIEWKQRWTFVICVLVMVVTHLYMFTNKLPNHDDVNRVLVGDTDEAKIQHGRWAGVIFDRVSGSSVGIPYVMGVISVLAFAGTAVVLVSLFRIEKRLMIVLLCGLLCTFPVSASIFLYSYIADAYFISMFLAVWGVWLLIQEKVTVNIGGIILLTLACGCYQAFWCMGMAFMFLYYFMEFLDLGDEWKKFGLKIAKCFAWATISLVLYLLINKTVQAVSGYGATDYQGLSAMGQFGGIRGFIRVFVYAYYEFAQFFYLKGGFTDSSFMIAVNVILTAAVVYMMFHEAKERKHFKGYWIIFILLVGLIPLAFNLISVVSMNQTHVLMQYTLLMPYIMCLLLPGRSRVRIRMIPAVSYALLFIVVYNGFLIDNVIYFRQQLNYEATYSYTIRLLSRIETMEGYDPSISVAFINENPQYYDHIDIMLENYPKEMEYFRFLDGIEAGEPHSFVKRANDISDFCKYYHGYDLQLADAGGLSDIAETKEFQDMPVYPQAGGMRYIDGILVVKLADLD